MRHLIAYALVGAGVMAVLLVGYFGFIREDEAATTGRPVATADAVDETVTAASTTEGDQTMEEAPVSTTAPTTEEEVVPTRGRAMRIPDDVRESMIGKSWKEGLGCPSLDDLRLLEIPHRPWKKSDPDPQFGQLVVHREAAKVVLDIFERLYENGFPIESMKLIDEFQDPDTGAWADDFESIEQNNTSAFNCRPVTGGTRLSNHAFGLAIDINPIQNPYVLNGQVFHVDSEVPAILERRKGVRGLLWGEDDPNVRAFTDAGWEWGGTWENPKDYQHFSRDGG